MKGLMNGSTKRKNMEIHKWATYGDTVKSYDTYAIDAPEGKKEKMGKRITVWRDNGWVENWEIDFKNLQLRI